MKLIAKNDLVGFMREVHCCTVSLELKVRQGGEEISRKRLKRNVYNNDDNIICLERFLFVRKIKGTVNLSRRKNREVKAVR